MPEVNPVVQNMHVLQRPSDFTEENLLRTSHISVDRPALTVERKQQKYSYEARPTLGIGEKLKNNLKDSCSCTRPKMWRYIETRLPFLEWLLVYDFRNWLLGDVIAGITVAIIHVPQGMAYALLAHLPPICGIYMGLFQSLAYLFFGTSRHSSMGSFAVATLMTGTLVMQLATFPPGSEELGTTIGSNFTDITTLGPNDSYIESSTTMDTIATTGSPDAITYTPVQIAAIVCFTTGVWHLILGFLNLGSLSAYLSDMLDSGFTAAAAFHIVTSQLKFCLGIKIKGFAGPFSVIYTFIAVAKALPSVNFVTLIISAITMVVVVINNEILKSILARYTKIPLPIELIVVIAGTTVSYFANFEDIYSIDIVGDIPVGLPPPMMPPLELFQKVLLKSFVIAIITYCVSLSLEKIIAKPHGYVVVPTQELYAMGLGNIFSSFFPCAPMASAIVRTVLQDEVGGSTQMASAVSCSILVLFLLFVGPVLEKLPKSVLAAIIVIAMKKMLWQAKDMVAMWKVSKAEATIWLVTFFGVVILDFDLGVLAGVLFSIFVLLSKNQTPLITKLGRVPNTDIYLDMETYAQAERITGISVLKVTGAIHFASKDNLRNQIILATGLDPTAILKLFKIMKKNNPEMDIDIEQIMLTDFNETKTYNLEISHEMVRYIVLDLSGVRYVDSTGGKLLNTLRDDYAKIGIHFCISGLSDGVLDMMERCGVRKDFPSHHLFHSIHDAIVILTSPKNRLSLY